MTNNFVLHFEGKLPAGTAQQKGEAIRYKNGRPYIQHYKKANVEALRTILELKLGKYAPAVPTDAPVRLFVWVCFDVKDRNLWGKYKTTRPDADNYVKELKDAMTTVGFWNDDAQVVDLRVVKTYAEKASITVQIETLGTISKIRGRAND